MAVKMLKKDRIRDAHSEISLTLEIGVQGEAFEGGYISSQYLCYDQSIGVAS